MKRETVFLIGAPRSGTTWLQHMLGAHPAIVTPQETDLFSAYVPTLCRLWRTQINRSTESGQRRRFKGLPAVFTAAEFDDVVLQFVSQVYEKIASLKPEASLILEKDPPYTHHIPLILRYFPEARFIQVLRDGRDVAASMVRAGRGWGSWWAPRSVAVAASRWKERVTEGRKARALTDRYLEVRYEDLLSAGGPASLQHVFKFCGLRCDIQTSTSLLERFSLNQMRKGESSGIAWAGEAFISGSPPPEPDGFYGQGGTGSWRDAWGRYQKLVFNRVAGDLLVDLGYETNSDWEEAHPWERLPVAAVTRMGALADRTWRTASRWKRGDRIPSDGAG